MTYYLAPDVHACRSGDFIIFLDVRNDRYQAAPAGVLELDLCGRRLCAHDEEGRQWGAKVLAQGLALKSPPADVAVSPAPLKPAHERPKALAFVAALLWAGRAVDAPLGMHHALRALRARRTHAPVDLSRARTEAALFQSWRPLWPRTFVCLHDTLALAWFLSARRVGCEIVFGVQARPFAAHCWAEAGGAVLNDEAEYCASFDVILRL